MDWEHVDAFRIAGTRQDDYPDLDLDDYLAKLGNQLSNLRIEDLKSRYVSVRYSGTEDFSRRWKLYQCLVSEQRINGRLHVLMESRWFVVADSLVDAVDSYYDSLPQARVNLPAATNAAEKEGDYNDRFAKSDPAHLLHLDAKIVRPGGASSGIEVCDVMTTNGEFLHIKRKSRSSTLSHLFAQGSISAEAFIGDGEFRDKIRAAIIASTDVPIDLQQQWLDLVPASNQTVDKSSYTVSYAVITSAKANQSWLPFFSKLNLRQHGKLLENMGLNVAISRIDVTSTATTFGGDGSSPSTTDIQPGGDR